MSIYSDEKVLNFPEQLVKLKNGTQPNPIYIHWVISDWCNQDCSFCAYRMSNYESNQLFYVLEDGEVNNNPRRQISLEKALETIHCFSEMGVKAVLLTGGGEPTTHPHFKRIVEELRAVGIKLGLNTNLVTSDKNVEILKEFEWARVSIDSYDEKSYTDVRRVSPTHWKTLIKNVQQIPKNREFVLGAGFVITKDNFQGLYQGVAQFKDWGFDNVRLSATFSPEKERYYDGIEKAVQAEIDRTMTLESADFKIFNQFKFRFGDLGLGTPDYEFCGIMHFVTYVAADLNVYTCCTQAYNKRGLIGSFQDCSFQELWDSHQKKKFMEGFKASGCSWCQFNKKNRAVNAVLTPNLHSEFI